jgi:serine/threonine protein kinase/Tol biopolymer transport system component
MSSLIGKEILHYRIVQKLGEGGMGVVYKAEDTKLDRTVALKFLPHHLTATEEEHARFLQEAKAAATLNHPNVCTIYGVEEYEDPDSTDAPAGRQQFIEMEFVDGVTLKETVEGGGWKTHEAVDFAAQIAEALQEAHSKGIVHRDIKSENIMINTRSKVKVMDFGLAKLRGSMKLTKASSTIGTLAYMAPEQIQGESVDARSDIFSFGVVFYEMLTGKMPFRGEHDAAMMYSILNEDPESITNSLPDAPAEIQHIVNRALEKDPADRYQSAEDMLIDLRRVKKQTGRVSRITKGVPPVSSSPEAPAEPVSRPAFGPKQIGLGAVALVVVAFLVWQIFLVPGEAPRPFQEMTISRLTNVGTAAYASISPGGRYVVHSVRNRGKISLWVRQVVTGSDVQIVEPFQGDLDGTTFSHDGNFIYYVRKDRSRNRLGGLYHIPVLGGNPRKILSDIVGPVTLSPDGTKMAFVRSLHNEGEEAIIIAGSDGSEERKLATRVGPYDFFIGGDAGPSWSPDGRVIACGAGTAKERFQMGVLLVSVEDGTQEWLGLPEWQEMNRVLWVPDGSGVVFAAQESGMGSQLWYLSYPEGNAQRITNDLNDYGGLSLGLTADGATLVTSVTNAPSNIWTVPRGDAGQAEQLTRGTGGHEGQAGISVAPDGRVLFTSTESGNLDLWIMEPDGGKRRQLTTHPRDDYNPCVTPDGQSVAFTSDRSGVPHIWKMGLDGTGLKQLTENEDYRPRCTPDGMEVVYYGWGAGTASVWKASIEGGEPTLLVEKPSRFPEISPDGKSLACRYHYEQGAPAKTAIIPIEGGEPVAILDIPAIANCVIWDRDGSSLLYVDLQTGTNIWSKPVTGGPPTQITDFSSGRIFALALAPDGETFVCSKGTSSTDVVLIKDFR